MSPSRPRLYADFQKLDDEGRTILVCWGTYHDLDQLGIELREGLEVVFYSDDGDDEGNRDDLEVDGVVEFDPASGQWKGRFDPEAFRHASDRR